MLTDVKRNHLRNSQWNVWNAVSQQHWSEEGLDLPNWRRQKCSELHHVLWYHQRWFFRSSRWKRGWVLLICYLMLNNATSTVGVYGLYDTALHPKLLYEKSLSESVQSLDHGHIVGADKEDIIVSTFSGRVLGLVERPPVTVSSCWCP